MKELANNTLSVLLWDPLRYRPPRHYALLAFACGALTAIAGWFAFGSLSLWIGGLVHLFGLVAFPCKILCAADAKLDDDDAGPALARAMFAASVALWPLGIAVAAGLPVELVGAIALHGVVQVWRQVVVQRTGRAAPRAHRFTRSGPAIGTFGGREIAAWLVDAQGTRYEFAGCTADPGGLALSEGQALVRPGIIYEARRHAAAGS